MGWASGSRLAGELISAANMIISSESEREKFFEELIRLFEDYDCDTLDECVGIDPVFDELWNDMHPQDDYYEDDDED
jgi:hypothetical protein